MALHSYREAPFDAHPPIEAVSSQNLSYPSVIRTNSPGAFIFAFFASLRETFRIRYVELQLG